MKKGNLGLCNRSKNRLYPAIEQIISFSLFLLVLCAHQEAIAQGILDRLTNPYAGITEAPDSFLLHLYQLEYSDASDLKIFSESYIIDKTYYQKTLQQAKGLITPKRLPLTYYDAGGYIIYQEGDVASYNEAANIRSKGADQLPYIYYLKSKFSPLTAKVQTDTFLVSTQTVQVAGESKKDPETTMTLEQYKASTIYTFGLSLAAYSKATDQLVFDKHIELTEVWENEYIPFEGKIVRLPKDLRKLARSNRKQPPGPATIRQNATIRLINAAAKEIGAFLKLEHDKRIGSEPVPVDQDSLSEPSTVNPSASSSGTSKSSRNVAINGPRLLSKVKSDLNMNNSRKGFRALESGSGRYHLWVSKTGGNGTNFKGKVVPQDSYNAMISYSGGSRGGIEATHWIDKGGLSAEMLINLIKATDYNAQLQDWEKSFQSAKWSGVEYIANSGEILEEEHAAHGDLDIRIIASQHAYKITKTGSFQQGDQMGQTINRIVLHLILQQPGFTLHIYKPIGYSSQLDRYPYINPEDGLDTMLYFLNNYIELL